VQTDTVVDVAMKLPHCDIFAQTFNNSIGKNAVKWLIEKN
jgi:hypothetical protein